ALIVQFAARGLGIGCVVRDFAEEKLRTGEIQELPLADPFPPRHICLLRREQAVSRASEMLMATFCM
ncbi:MAG: LysR substrate-binding domain-containing protein, partial [Acutalibacteraceae bacterium]|nr:LysR substrate-binding domain-containing protein [Acutalibacteraceae bacterium]